MKKGLLLIALVAFTGKAFAQSLSPDYYVEVGAYGGIAPFSKPDGTHEKGDKNVLPVIWGANVHYNITDHWQVGLETTVSRWKATGTTSLEDLNNQHLGTADVHYLYADRAWTATLRANRMIPYYDKYHVNRSNFYFGIALGAAFTVNDGATTYTQFRNEVGQQYRYVSAYNYESGAGYTFGLQAGWSYYFAQHFGFNVEFAPRFTHIGALDTRQNTRNSEYNTFTFPVMAGLRVRF